MNIRKLSKRVFKAPVEIVQGAWDAFEETVNGEGSRRKDGETTKDKTDS